MCLGEHACGFPMCWCRHVYGILMYDVGTFRIVEDREVSVPHNPQCR